MDWSKIHLPPHFIINAAIFVGLVVVVVLAIRFVRRTNKIFLTIFLAAVFGVVFFNWVYNRNEPRFLTPVIEPIARSGFFPTKEVPRKQMDPLR